LSRIAIVTLVVEFAAILAPALDIAVMNEDEFLFRSVAWGPSRRAGLSKFVLARFVPLA
jgi:hypothetical protein